MTGVEYMLLHVQEPILYVIRKVHRQAPDRGITIPPPRVAFKRISSQLLLWQIITS